MNMPSTVKLGKRGVFHLGADYQLSICPFPLPYLIKNSSPALNLCTDSSYCYILAHAAVILYMKDS